MKLRPTKASGSFDFNWEGSFELIVHMEADPRAHSFARFNFQSVLPPDKACAFFGLPAYLLRHELGLFAIAVLPSSFTFTGRIGALWREADRILAKRSTWLFSTSIEALLREPHWSNAQRIAQCANAEVAPADHDRVVEFLADAGQAPLRECVRRCEESIDSCDAALKLVSSGILHFNAFEPLSLNSQIRLQPHNPASSVGWLQSPPDFPRATARPRRGSR
jgi:hypothetical protein